MQQRLFFRFKWIQIEIEKNLFTLYWVKNDLIFEM